MVTRASRGRIQRAEDLLRAILVVERRAVDGRHEVAGPQAQARESLAVGARIDAEAAHLAAREHRLRPHDLADDAGIVAHELAHAVEHRVVAGDGCGQAAAWRTVRRRTACAAGTRIRARRRDR